MSNTKLHKRERKNGKKEQHQFIGFLFNSPVCSDFDQCFINRCWKIYSRLQFHCEKKFVNLHKEPNSEFSFFPLILMGETYKSIGRKNYKYKIITYHIIIWDKIAIVQQRKWKKKERKKWTEKNLLKHNKTLLSSLLGLGRFKEETAGKKRIKEIVIKLLRLFWVVPLITWLN